MDIENKKILDVTCGGRSIWFDKNHPLALFCDKREVEYEQTFGKAQPATRHIKVHPDMIADFTDLPFDDESFNLVVFDPPHIVSPNGNNRWLTKAYGHYTSRDEALESVSGGGAGVHESVKTVWSSCNEMGGDVYPDSGDNKSYWIQAAIRTKVRKKERD